MNCRKSLVVLLAFFSLVTTICYAQSVRRWDFNTPDEREGWQVEPGARGVVMGGTLWVTLTSTPAPSTRLYEGIGRSWPGFQEEGNLLTSEGDLNIPAEKVTQVRLRILNLSPVTDFLIQWRTAQTGWGPDDWRKGRFLNGMFDLPPQSTRCAVRPQVKQWQEITCYLRGPRLGTINQLALRTLNFVPRGDLWIDWIEIGAGSDPPTPPRPDVASSRVVPHVTIPGISQSGFADAFKVLDESMVVDVPAGGFTHPFISAGGNYREYWWFALDTSIAAVGAMWVNPQLAEGTMRGFRDLQAENADGRIDMYTGSTTRGLMAADKSQLPRFFGVAYDVARRTSDGALREEIYDTMRQFLDWWISPAKRDAKTGLIQATHEDGDTLGELPGWSNPPAVAPVDLNVAVAIGAAYTARLAARLGKGEEAGNYQQVFEDLARAINATLWDEKDGAYYNYNLTEGQPRRRMIVTTFDPLRLAIASAARRDRLIERLLDPYQFNWGRVPLTSLVMTDPGYVALKGDYGDGAWTGGVWTFRNLEVIRALEEAERPDLAAELNWATVKAFHANYHEFLNPSDGSGQGTDRYAATASQYIEAVIEHLFGVDFDSMEHRVRIAPHVPRVLYGEDLALNGLILPTGGDTRLSVHIRESSPTAATVRVDITGPLPQGDLVVTLPGSGKEHRVSMRRSYTAKFP